MVGNDPVIVAPGARGRKSGIVLEFRHVECTNHLRPLMRKRANNDKLTSATIEHAHGTAVRMQRALAFRNKFVSTDRNFGDVCLVHVEICVKKRRLDKLTLASSLPVQQGN